MSTSDNSPSRRAGLRQSARRGLRRSKGSVLEMALQNQGESCCWSAAGCRLIARRGTQAQVQGRPPGGRDAPAPVVVAVAVWVEDIRFPGTFRAMCGAAQRRRQGRGEGGAAPAHWGGLGQRTWHTRSWAVQLIAPVCTLVTWAVAKSHFRASSFSGD